MKKLIYAFSALVLVLTTSCSSDSDSPVTPEDGILLKKVIETEPGGDSFTTNYTYNGNKLVKTADNEGYYENYTYTGDVITKIEFYDDADVMYQKEVYTYNASQQLTSFQRVVVPFDTGEKEVYTYSGSNVNVTYYYGDAASQTDVEGTGVITFANGETATVTKTTGTTNVITYAYDTKNCITKNILGFDKISIADVQGWGNNFNVLTETHSSGDLVTTTYTYNAQNYPITCTEVDTRLAGTSSFQFFYE